MREAEKRGLSNLKNTVEALPAFVAQKSIDVFTRHNVLTETEIRSRYEILLENYCKTLRIEALTMVDMVKKEIIPACISYQNELLQLLRAKSRAEITTSAWSSTTLKGFPSCPPACLKTWTPLKTRC